MFVSLRPSTRGGELPSPKLESFYKLLEKEGFENAHMTDLVKCRGPVGNIPDYHFQNCIPHLLEEIEILEPKMIVAVGKEAQKKLKENEIQCRFIPHYAYRFKKRRISLRKALKDIKEKLEEMKQFKVL